MPRSCDIAVHAFLEGYMPGMYLLRARNGHAHKLVIEKYGFSSYSLSTNAKHNLGL
jgi:hypothetical protein